MMCQRIRTRKLPIIINVGGLALALAAVLLIAKWVQNERSYDGFHKQADRIHLLKTLAQSTGNEGPANENTPYPLGMAIANGVPELELTTQMLRIARNELTLKNGTEIFREENSTYVDENWFDVFSYRFIEGSPALFNAHPNNLIITDSRAKKIFGTSSAVGKIVIIDSTVFTVSGVIADNQPNSSFQFNAILPLKSYLKTANHLVEMNDWQYSPVKTFVRLHSNASTAIVEEKINKIIKEHETARNNIGLLPLRQMYFHSEFQTSAFQHGDNKRVTIFTWLAIILLVTASINYVNFSIAKIGDRVKELCIRKITGATATQLFLQVMAEALINTLIAMVIAITLAVFAMPLLKNISGSVFTDFSINTSYISIIATVLVAVILLTGLYPAIILSSQKTMNLLKGHMFLNIRNSWFKQALIVGQFAFALFMIIATIVAQRQLIFIQKENNAYNKSQVFTATLPPEFHSKLFRFSGDAEKNKQVEIARESFLSALKHELQNLPQIMAISRASFSSVVNNNYVTGRGLNWDGKPDDFNPSYIAFDAEKSIAGILNLQLAQGRWFDDKVETDQKNIILNESAVKKFGIRQPVIGKRINEGIVIGVVKDFYHQNMREPIVPLVYRIDGPLAEAFIIQSNPSDVEDALTRTQAVFKQFFPNSVFEYSFADDEFERLYRADRNFLFLAFIFSGLSILISVLGLLGLTLFMINRRRKEIGIRKVMGASVSGITVLLTKDLLKLVMIAIIIATPLGWWAMNNWLHDYQYRIRLSWWMFALASVIGMGIAILTLGLQAARAALANPAETLKSE
ncbi:ABC transporter permease [Flavitalea sp.]|nr:ABC transporter permease [Flavitalea sp.]